MAEKKSVGKSLVPTYVEAITLAEYKKMEENGLIKRPLTDRVVPVRTKMALHPES